MMGEIEIGITTEPEDTPAEPLAKEKKCVTSLHNAVQALDVDLCLRLIEDEGSVNALDDRDGSSPLHTLARTEWKVGCAQVAARLLEKGAKVNTTDHEGHTPLHIAARDGRLQLCQLLVDHEGAKRDLNLNARQKSDLMTPLHYAAREGWSDVVELLLQKGANPLLLDKTKWLPLHHAANKGYKDCCRLLASSYSHPISPDVPPPLSLAALKGYYKCCKELVPDENSLRHCDIHGNTPLHVVAKRGFKVFVELLLDLGAPIDIQNKSGNTSIMEAVKKDKLICVQMLAERGASLTEINQDQSNVLHLAASCKSHKCLMYLLSCKSIANQLDVKDGKNLSALYIAAKKMDEISFTMLIKAGASPTCCPDESVLHFRPVFRRPGMLKTMLFHDGLDIRLCDDKGVTPLHIAAEEGVKAACSLLLSHGARINALDNSGKSSLYVGAATGNAEVVRFLVNNGAGLRAKEYKTKFTALHAAAAAGSRQCCQILLDADFGLGSVKDLANKYALDVAFESDHQEVVELLLENFKSLPKDLKKRLHEYTRHSILTQNRAFLEKLFRSKWWEVGCGRMTEDPGCQNFSNIIRPYPDLACEIMTRCRKDSLNNFTLLENTTHLQKEGSSIDKHPVGVMVDCENLELLQHPLVEAWLHYKWCSYARWLFLSRLLLRLFTVLALIILLLFTDNGTQIEKRYNLTQEDICGGVSVRDESREAVTTLLRYPVTFLVHILLAVALLLEMSVEMICLRKTRILHMEMFLLRLSSLALGLAALLPTSLCELTHGIKSVYAWECGILALLIAWFDLIHNINKLPQFTMFSALNMKFFKGYIKGLMYLGMVVLVFSFAFHLLLNDQASFRTVPLAMVQVVVWMIGELNYNDNFLNAKLDYPILSTILFLLLVCTIGAFFVTLIKSPSCDKKKLRYYKQTVKIYLLLKLDICFPWFRNLCLCYKYDENEKIPNLFVRILEHFGYGGGKADATDSTQPQATKGKNNLEKLIALCEKTVDFFQMDDNDDDVNEDDGGQREDLVLMKKTLEQHTKKLDGLTSRLDRLMQYYEQNNDLAQ